MKDKKRFRIYQNHQFVKDYAYLGDARNRAFYLHLDNPMCDFCIYDSLTSKIVWAYIAKFDTVRRYA